MTTMAGQLTEGPWLSTKASQLTEAHDYKG